jgi:hypothetical protein
MNSNVVATVAISSVTRNRSWQRLGKSPHKVAVGRVDGDVEWDGVGFSRCAGMGDVGIVAE